MEYLLTVKRWLEQQTRGHAKTSICDVGSGQVSYPATWGDFRERYAIDVACEPIVPGAVCCKADWLELNLEDLGVREPFSIITCLQVIEHLDAKRVYKFTRKLLDNAQTVIVSVPLLWPKGECKDHLLDPVTLRSLVKYMHGRQPRDYKIVVDAYHDKGLRFVGMWQGGK